jgi:ribosomal protein L40E
MPNADLWIRTCQECGHKQPMRQPSDANKMETWRNAKCRKCQSEALDYGSGGWTRTADGKLQAPTYSTDD